MELIEKNPYILSLVFSVISIIILYIDDKYISNKKVEVIQYVKFFVLLNISSMACLYIVKKLNNINNSGSKIEGVKSELEDITNIINENPVNKIHTGNPNF